jgi:hypothetical protein
MAWKIKILEWPKLLSVLISEPPTHA